METFSFQTDVLDRSFELPVLVDFWAPWCGPCRVLTPVLEEIAEEYGGRFELVKINTEEHQELAYQFGIRSIPNVKMFYEGEMINEFMGALPKSQILSWLSDVLPTEEKNSFDDMLQKVSGAGPDEALQILEAYAAQSPEHTEARILLNKYRFLNGQRVDRDFLASFALGNENHELAQQLLLLDQFQQSDLVNGKKAGQMLENAQREMHSKNWKKMADHIIKAVITDKSYLDELPRRLGVALFQVIGDEDPSMAKTRKLFNMALY